MVVATGNARALLRLPMRQPPISRPRMRRHDVERRLCRSEANLRAIADEPRAVRADVPADIDTQSRRVPLVCPVCRRRVRRRR